MESIKGLLESRVAGHATGKWGSGRSDQWRNLWKKLKTTNKGKLFKTHRLEKLNTLKMAQVLSLQSQCNPYHNFDFIFFTEIEQIILCTEPQNISNDQSDLKKIQAGGISFPDLKIHYKAMAIKMVWYWHKKTLRSIELNRQLRKRKQKTLLHGQLTYDEEARKSQ